MKTPDFTKYYRYAEAADLLRGIVAAFPNLATLESIGKSYEGRDIWALTVTGAGAGPAAEKPGFYIDANIHGSEVTSSVACLYIAWRLVSQYSDDAAIARLVDQNAFYLIPMVSPDGVEHCLRTPGRVRSGTRAFPYEETQDGLHPEDINGDGMILQMRINDPSGGWKVSERDARLLVPRAFHDAEGAFYRVIPEGMIRNFDGVEVNVAPSPHGLDFNRNFPANWRVPSRQGGAGDFPFSEPETRAVGEFVKAHPNICGLHSFHTGFESIISAPCWSGDKSVPAEDLRRIRDIGAYGKEATGYALFSYNDLYENIYEAYGDFATWAWEHWGLIYYCDELWDLRARGNPDPMEVNRLEKKRDHRALEEIALKGLEWNDEALNGEGFVRWTPFDHPQLGPVEIGGWKPLLRNNAPESLLEDTCEKIAGFALAHAQASPRIRADFHETESLGDNVYRIAVSVVNGGYLPTNITRQAIDVGKAKPVEARIELREGDRLLSGDAVMKLGHLAGYGGRKKAEWIVRFAESPEASIRVVSEKGGVQRLRFRAD